MPKIRTFSSLPAGATFIFSGDCPVNESGPWVKVADGVRIRPSMFAYETPTEGDAAVVRKRPDPVGAVILRSVLSDDFIQALAALQTHLGETDGGFAGMYYSGKETGEVPKEWAAFSMTRRIEALYIYVQESEHWRRV